MALAQFSSRKTVCVSTQRSRMVVCASTALPKQFKAVKPIADRVLLKVDKEEAKSLGGVLLPASAQKKSNCGTVVSVGEASLVQNGDRVVYSKFAGTEISVQDQDHVLLKEEDVIGKVGGDNKIARLQPLSDRIVIKAAAKETKTAGGLLLTPESADKPTFGTVVAVGPGKPKKEGEEGPVVKPNLKEGQTVLYSKYTGVEFEEDDVEYVVIREADILAALS